MTGIHTLFVTEYGLWVWLVVVLVVAVACCWQFLVLCDWPPTTSSENAVASICMVLNLHVRLRGSVAFRRKKNQVCCVWQPVFPPRFVQFLVAVKEAIILSLAQTLFPILLTADIAVFLTNLLVSKLLISTFNFVIGFNIVILVCPNWFFRSIAFPCEVLKHLSRPVCQILRTQLQLSASQYILGTPFIALFVYVHTNIHTYLLT
jgi:hypothetical protein